MSKRLSFAVIGMMFSLGLFSTTANAHSEYKHHHKHHHKHKNKHKHKHKKVVVVKHKRPKHYYYHYKRIPPRSTYIQIGNFTYLKVDDHYYKRSRDRYVHVVL
ncbi:hypothetical protein ACPV4A_01790 [Vibrio rotiferianus]|uniref:hypothetical protein n=1 Tax=Vibrio rotiferianus TaxID=190895 RepID=UPI00406A3CB2